MPFSVLLEAPCATLTDSGGRIWCQNHPQKREKTHSKTDPEKHAKKAPENGRSMAVQFNGEGLCLPSAPGQLTRLYVDIEIYSKKNVGLFGVLGSAVSDPLSEPLLRRFRDAPRANFTKKNNDFATFLSRSWPRFFMFLAPILELFWGSFPELFEAFRSFWGQREHFY